MTRAYRHSTTLPVSGSELEVTFTFGVVPGCAPSRDDPGAPAELNYLRVHTVEGKPAAECDPTLIAELERQGDLLEADLLASAGEDDEADRDAAAEARRESLRPHRQPAAPFTLRQARAL